jgi:PRTRC genetic system ThiF family protein
MDGDTISSANTIRQPFCQAEVGLAKAGVMASRLNLFWGLSWTAVAEELTPQSETANFDLWIGCVDTRAARKVIQDHVQGWRSHAAYWLDIGNSADSGQFVLGQPWNGRNRRSAVRLRTAPEILPEIVETSLDTDGAPSCSALEALEIQEPFVNHTLAYHALGLLSRLFRYGRIEHHGGFMSMAAGRVQPLPISPAIWRKMHRRGRRHLGRKTA